MLTNQKQVRAAFWEAFPEYTRQPGKSQNDYPADVRVTFVDWVDGMQKSGMIPEALAERVTL